MATKVHSRGQQQRSRPTPTTHQPFFQFYYLLIIRRFLFTNTKLITWLFAPIPWARNVADHEASASLPVSKSCGGVWAPLLDSFNANCRLNCLSWSDTSAFLKTSPRRTLCVFVTNFCDYFIWWFFVLNIYSMYCFPFVSAHKATTDAIIINIHAHASPPCIA